MRSLVRLLPRHSQSFDFTLFLFFFILQIVCLISAFNGGLSQITERLQIILSSLEILYDFLDFDSIYLETDEKLYTEIKIEKEPK